MKRNNLILGIFLAIIGILMIFYPAGCIKAVVILLGIEALANGIYQLLYERKLFPDAMFQYSVLIRSMFSIVVGLLAICIPLVLVSSVIKFITFLLALYFLIASILLVYAIGKLRGSSVDRRPFVIEALISFGLAVLLFLIPGLISAEAGLRFVRFIGILSFLVGALFVFLYIKYRPYVQEVVEVMDDVSGNLENSTES